MRIGVVLVGHGVPATDCPAQWVGELMALEWGAGNPGAGSPAPQRRASAEQGATSAQASERIAELDRWIRDWPRTPENDPYKVGLERLADALKPLLGGKAFALAYNEFCRPTVPEAIEGLIAQGAERILVAASMMTPGGIHSERDIPQAIERVRARFPQVRIEYLWPMDLKAIASLLAGQIHRALAPHL